MALPTLHEQYMEQCLELASKSPPKPTNYRVGAVLVSASENRVLATGYTRELPGNTHAEQCCFAKLASSRGLSEEHVGEVLPAELDAVLYTSMEPCVHRLSGNISCVERILQAQAGSNDRRGGVRSVYCGVSEPETFVEGNDARRRLQEAGIKVLQVNGFEDRSRSIATTGHAERTE